MKISLEKHTHTHIEMTRLGWKSTKNVKNIYNFKLVRQMPIYRVTV